MKSLLSVLLLTLSMQVSANTIEGAFGLKLGKVVPQKIRFDKYKDRGPYWFKFNTVKPLAGYDNYYFRLSPVKKKVVSIHAEGHTGGKQSNCEGSYNDLKTYFEYKYGENDREYISLSVYRVEFKSKSGIRRIVLECTSLKQDIEYFDYNEYIKAENEEKGILIRKHSDFDL